LKEKFNRYFIHFGGVIAVLSLFSAAFYLSLPPQFTKFGISITDELLLLVIMSLIYFAFQQSKWAWKYVSLLLTLLAFALPLLRLWVTAGSTWNIVLGLLPWQDAVGYYLDATNLVNGGLFSPFSGRRPLFASFLAVLLKTDQQNLHLVLIVFAMLTGLAVFLFAQEIRDEFGPFPAVVIIYLLQFFYRPYVGTTLTEQLGLLAGLLAFVLLLQGVKRPNQPLFVIGLMTLTFALLARAGAFFVLPILFVYGILHFAKNRQAAFKVGSVLIVAVAIPVLLNIWLGKVVASPNTIRFGNFSYTLYGQVVGGKGWTQIFNDHPEINSLQEPVLSRQIYRLAWDEFKRNPFNLFRGIGKAWIDFVLPSDGSVFSYLLFGSKTLDFVFQIVVTLLYLWGVWLAWLNRQSPVYGLTLLTGLGVFLSIPFLPPVDAGIRPYAAIMAIVFLYVAVALSKIFSYLKVNWQADKGFPVTVGVVISLGMICSASLGGILVKAISSPAMIHSINCSSRLRPAYIKLTSGSYVELVDSNSAKTSKVPRVLIKDILRSFSTFPYGDFASVIRKIKQPALLTTTTDISSGTQLWIIAPPELELYQNKVISICGELVSDQYPVLQVKTFEIH
jgi:hypothetical protein